ncbi:hypothetical protein LSTR_LSTR003783 [Laodelphax striatellus]|uniref:Zinc finger homeobox protein 4 n=1 Tax=Laodelphax striatellus TaxID=195883 RepID=A0A482WFD4_LAOST|nr:hypothetical protein LSTR_LSTR003783 [Laodelphax striatellus]
MQSPPPTAPCLNAAASTAPSPSLDRPPSADRRMSPEEESSASPPAGLVAGGSREAADERRMSSPPSGSKFVHDDCEEPGRTKEEDSWTTSDVEKFDGKIVYNPDGSAYIIEDSEMSEDDAVEIPQLIRDGCIVDGPGVSLSQFQVFPQIANAFYVSRNNVYNALYGGGGGASATHPYSMHDKKIVPEVPIMHSYRVYTVRDNKTGADGGGGKASAGDDDKPSKDCSSVPVKPILMCFICKLSFGYAKSFVAHAMGDHNVVLQDDERDILGHKNCSAIIQCVGKQKEPLVSFLEPLSPPVVGLKAPPSPARASPVDESTAAASQSTSSPQQQQSTVQNQHVPETSVSLPEHSGSSSSNNNNNNDNVNNLSSVNSGSRMSMNNCVMDLTRKSPAGSQGGRSSVSPSPGASPSPGTTLSPLLGGMPPYPQPPPNFLTGTTIGVCPDHMAGRPSGVECAKCELILTSSRLGGGGGGGPLAGMHTRNSCKTLKCPKCNWHYKYQETLEIHMKEKHPETETSCIYCIAGQPHPRLARGETYTCGYKPYRCEVCNYSTTTKGNLSIHMQSDKHLNNMQELQNGGVSNTDQLTQQHQQSPSPQSQQHHKSGGLASPGPGHHHPHHSSPLATQSQKPKPTFRCDVCNYETNVARNLRIHMTSEKHTHNMMVLQQNVKHMQTLNAIQQSHQQQMGFESLLFHPGMTLPGDKPPPHTEAALADMAYNQALLIQMMTGGQLPPHIPPELAPHMDMGLNPETMEPPPEPADPDPEHLFQCCVCNVFASDNLEALSHHLAADRTKIREQEILAVVAGHYVCKLCTYKTNLKANFQLHCKTDKHLQRLQHVNHVKEGGPRNEWKLKYVSSPGGVQVRCHACDYYTNSAHKLQLHTAGQRHEASALLFRHLRDQDRSATSPRIYHCALCGFSSRNKLPLLQHVRSMKHLQMEQIHQLQRRTEGKDVQTDIGEVFQILTPPPDTSEPESTENCDLTRDSDSKPDLKDLSSPNNQCSSTDSQQRQSQDSVEESPKASSKESSSHMCPYCNYTSSSEMRIQAHVLAQHSQTTERPRSSPSPVKETFLCPLCQDGFKDKPQLERHVMQIHSVNSEGLQRLLLLVDQSHWLNTVSRQNTTTNQNLSPSSSSGGKDQEQKQNTSDSSLKMDEDKDEVQNLSSSEEQPEDENRCQTCSKLFRNIDELCAHQNETGHLELKQTPSGPGYLCWKKGCNQYFQSAHSLQMHFREIHARGGGGASNMAVSEKHVYKYRCNQCSLAFKTMEKLQMHSQYHLIRDATKCVLCGRNFRSMISLNKHVEMFHADMNEEEMMAYKQSLMNNPLLLAGLSGQILDPSFNELLKKETMKADDDVMEVDDSPGKDVQDDGSTPAGDGENSDDSIVYREQQFLEDYLNSQAIAEDSYNDPNRKYKCHRCKVAFTRQSYLTSHNKTLLHRKGEKLSYPMEKYLDPNRPYKCDVCKESFTQKNILLVHYNSVSHLHKLKRAMQEQQQNNNNNTPVSPQTAASVAAAAALVAGLGVAPSSAATLNSKLMSSSSTEEDDKKPYKCNICKVAYSQGSTLDIHMRSVLHQTRASKIQDLALSGQIDLSKPLIEQPEPQKVQDQHKKSIQDILGSPKHLTSPSGSSISTQVPSLSQGSSPGTPITSGASSTPNLSTVPTSLVMSSAASSTTSTTSVIPSPTQHGNVISCQRCSALFMTQEQLTTHQQLYCLFGSPMSLFPPLPSSATSSQNTMTQSLASPHTSNNKSPSPIPLTPNDDAFSRMALPTKKSSQMYKHLLESFGFDLVMQFNENHQRRQRKEREENEKLMSEITSTTTIEEQQPIPIPMEEVPVEPEPVEMKMEEEPIEPDLPEVSKSTCQHCNKEFSSVWVLKAHCEEVHRDLVPLDFLEKYAQKFKNEYEKKSVPTTTASTTTSTVSTSTSTTAATAATTSISSTTSTTTSTTTSSSTDVTPEKEVEDSKEAIQAKLGIQAAVQQEATKVSATVSTPQQPTPLPLTPTENVTRASTPTASSTPASSTDSIPASMSNPLSAAGVSGNNSNPNIPMSLAQQMNEMQAALNVMAASQLQQQLQFNPMMMGMAGLGMGLPLGLNMPAIAAMNLQPPLVPMMMPPPPFDPMVGLGQGQNPLFQQQQSSIDTASLLAKQQQHLLQQQQAVNASQQKRARTRITDDQLKILRAHFDINNSPSEEQIHDMAGQSGLPPKVIKHWFRNTLFKERQRNKDSPYNFNNPPSTTLNLEEYEKTGEAKVMPLNTSCDDLQSPSSTPSTKEPPTTPTPVSASVTQPVKKPPPPQSPQSTISSQIQQSPQSSPTPQKQSQLLSMTSTPSSSTSQNPMQQMSMSQSMPFPHPPEQIKTEPREITPQSHLVESQEQQKFNTLMLETESRLKREIMDEKPSLYQHGQLHSPPSPSLSDRMNTIPSRNTSPENLTLSSIISSQLGPDGMPSNSGLNIPSSHSNMLPPKLTATSFATPPTQVATSSALCLTPTSRSISPGRSNSSDCFTHALLAGAGGNSNGSNSSGGSSGKRANRTRFTDYQIKVLQEFFENNAYPKDDDLEYLSKLLSLSPRVIVVWFQNARQKARKVYENQPPVEPAPGIDESGANRFQRTPGLNYQCKKCLLVFQRYYELIRHQKTHCFKEEDAKRSAQAQAAAAQIAAVLSSEDSNSSTIIEQNQQSSMTGATPTSNPSTPAAPVTPTPSQSMYPPSPVPPSTPTPDPKENSFQCDNCNLVFPRFDLWREHQLVHIMNPNLFPSYPPDSPFGILQQHAQMQQQAQQQQQQQAQQQAQQHQQQNMNLALSDLNMSQQTAQQHPLISMLTANKRKFEEFEEMCEREGEQPKDKRLRTTILPEQLDYLYQKYQVESNPSRKMLENIAREVGLKKRVVQVWFQNTRARERKGQFRAHSQVINKRCPFCPALFKVKSALESHLATKHGDHCGRGEINIDSLPDEDVSSESTPTYASSQGGGDSKASATLEANRQNMNIMPPIFPPFNSEMENSLKKYYEESMKRYISGLQTQHATQNGGVGGKDGADLRLKGEGNQQAGEGGTGGDSPLDLSRPMKLTLDQEVRSYLADPGPLTDLSERSLCDDDNLSLSLSISWSESMDNLDGDESNPTSPASSPQSGGQQRPSAHKRYRTQMSSLQVKVMKSLFNDYKTPTMTECEMLGKEIGLPKRVVQVWFQNARAKEKKTKLALQKVLGGSENDTQRLPEECKLCQFKYSHKYSVQDHIFTKSHIEVVKAYLESRMSKADLSGNASDGEFTIPSVPGGASDVVNNNNNNNTSQQQQLAQLQILQQMASLNLPAHAMAAMAAAKLDPKEQHPSPDEMALLHQLYGLGLSFPQSFMHPGMLSSTGLGELTGTSIAQLQLEPSAMQTLLNACAGDSDTLKLTPTGVGGSSDASCSSLVALLCKKCRLAFKSEPAVNAHIKLCGGSVLKVMSNTSTAKENYQAAQQSHYQAAQQSHYQATRSLLQQHQDPPPSESPLSHEMEDVVNQITALAAQAQAQAHGTSDSNANLFCPPPEPKKPKLFSPPPGVAVPSTGQ